MEQTEPEHTALVCCCSRRRTQQVHHRAAWTRGQGNSRRGCHCSLAGRRKLPEAHQRPATGGALSFHPATIPKYLETAIALGNIHTPDISCYQSVLFFMEMWDSKAYLSFAYSENVWGMISHVLRVPTYLYLNLHLNLKAADKPGRYHIWITCF